MQQVEADAGINQARARPERGGPGGKTCLQASLDVAARGFAPSGEKAFDIPLRLSTFRSRPGIRYPALRRLLGRDSHQLELYSMQPPSPHPHALGFRGRSLHDASYGNYRN